MRWHRVKFSGIQRRWTDAAEKFNDNVRQAEGNGLVAAGGAGLVVFGVYQLTVWREVLTLQIAGAELCAPLRSSATRARSARRRVELPEATRRELAEPPRLRSLTVGGVVWAKSAACEPMATRSGIQVLQSMNVMDQ